MDTPLCAPPDIEQVADQFAAPFEELEQEEIVSAEECPGLSFQGTTLAGCCDPTGVCGVSTASFAGNDMLPFNIPVTCISQADATAIGLAPMAATADAGAPIACSGGN
jgi:hypothetical protein